MDPAYPALLRYARVGALLSGIVAEDAASGCDHLLEKLEEWQDLLCFPRLEHFGIRSGDLDHIVSITRSKSNAVHLDPSAMKRILHNRL